MKNCIDMPIFHRAICAENVTNKPLSDKRNCIRSFLLRYLERKRSRNGGYYGKIKKTSYPHRHPDSVHTAHLNLRDTDAVLLLYLGKVGT